MCVCRCCLCLLALVVFKVDVCKADVLFVPKCLISAKDCLRFVVFVAVLLLYCVCVSYFLCGILIFSH